VPNNQKLTTDNEKAIEFNNETLFLKNSDLQQSVKEAEAQEDFPERKLTEKKKLEIHGIRMNCESKNVDLKACQTDYDKCVAEKMKRQKAKDDKQRELDEKQAKLDRNQAQIDQQQKNLDVVQNGLDNTQTRLDQNKTSLDSRKTNIEMVQKALDERKQQLKTIQRASDQLERAQAIKRKNENRAQQKAKDDQQTILNTMNRHNINAITYTLPEVTHE
jgi:chromosome segregation ATPase